MVEVLMAILILSIAIIPMFTMFDSALRSADTGSDYDRARAFANQKLEEAKNVSYDELADRFPGSSLLVTPESGSTITSTSIDADGQTGASDAGGPYPGVTYRITKQFVDVPVTGSELDASDDGDEGLIKVTVVAAWDGSDTYTVTGVVSR